MRRLTHRLIALTVLALLGIGVVWLLVNRPPPAPDTNALSDAVNLIEQQWPALDSGTLAEVGRPLTVVAADGQVVFASPDGPAPGALQAARSRALVAPVTVNGQIVATVYLRDDLSAAEATTRRATVIAAAAIIVVMLLVTAGLLVWDHRRIVRPFGRLRDYATRVAAGDLDAPLTMDRGNVFGAWSESFDLLRTELAHARRREQATQESKRTLVAQIGHDVRTPVASISATAELLRLQQADPGIADRLDVIIAKAAQVDDLVSDLFRANQTQLAALTVTPVDLPAADLTGLIAAADYEGRVQVAELPGVLLRADPGRLAQVFDNVVANAYKYAGTPVEVSARVSGASLEVVVADRGPGVPEPELGTIFGRGVRGSAVGDIPGQGLGLFTCAYLMERMDGDITAANTADGFAVIIAIPLA